MLSLFILEVARNATSGQKSLLLYLIAFALTFAAIAMRRVGIALVPPLITGAFLWRGRRWWSNEFPLRARLAIGGLLMLGVALLSFWWTSTATLSDYPGVRLTERGFADAVGPLQFRMIELAEVVVNLPVSKLPQAAAVTFAALGLVIAGLLVVVMFNRGSLGVCETYCLSYGAIMIVWPYQDARFLLPVIPFILTYCYMVLARFLKSSWTGVAFGVWMLAFGAPGVMALVYSARITMASPGFPERYGDGALRDTYCAHLNTCTTFEPSKVNAQVLKVLDMFDKAK